MATRNSYGNCPICGAKTELRERRINGNDTCRNGHVYPSAKAVLPLCSQCGEECEYEVCDNCSMMAAAKQEDRICRGDYLRDRAKDERAER